MAGSRSVAFLKVVAATLLFSVNPTLFRLVELPPAEIFWSVNILALLVIVLFMLLTGRLAGLPTAFRSQTGQFCLLGAIFTANNLLFISAIKNTTIANATFTHYLAPVFVLVLGLVLLGERIEVRGVFAVFLSLSGLGLVLSVTGLVAGSRHFVGIVLGTASALFFAQEIVLKKKLVSRSSALTVVALYLSVSAVLLLPFVSLSRVFTVGLYDCTLLLFSGVLASGVGITLFTSGLRDIQAQEAGIISYIEPLGAVLWGAVLLTEIPSVRTLLGGFLILFGTCLIYTRPDSGAGYPGAPT